MQPVAKRIVKLQNRVLLFKYITCAAGSIKSVIIIASLCAVSFNKYRVIYVTFFNRDTNAAWFIIIKVVIPVVNHNHVAEMVFDIQAYAVIVRKIFYVVQV